jgi:hypothetical protein
LVVPATKLQIGDRAFAVAGARHWNALPERIRKINDISNFKRQLKTHLFCAAFNIIAF